MPEWLKPIIDESDNILYLFLAAAAAIFIPEKEIAMLLVSACLIKVKGEGKK